MGAVFKRSGIVYAPAGQDGAPPGNSVRTGATAGGPYTQVRNGSNLREALEAAFWHPLGMILLGVMAFTVLLAIVWVVDSRFEGDYFDDNYRFLRTFDNLLILVGSLILLIITLYTKRNPFITVFGMFLIGAIIVPTQEITRFFWLMTNSEKDLEEVFFGSAHLAESTNNQSKAQNVTQDRRLANEIMESVSFVSQQIEITLSEADVDTQCILNRSDAAEQGIFTIAQQNLVDSLIGCVRPKVGTAVMANRQTIIDHLMPVVVQHRERQIAAEVRSRGLFEALETAACGSVREFIYRYREHSDVRVGFFYLKAQGLVSFPSNDWENTRVTALGRAIHERLVESFRPAPRGREVRSAVAVDSCGEPLVGLNPDLSVISTSPTGAPVESPTVPATAGADSSSEGGLAGATNQRQQRVQLPQAQAPFGYPSWELASLREVLPSLQDELNALIERFGKVEVGQLGSQMRIDSSYAWRYLSVTEADSYQISAVPLVSMPSAAGADPILIVLRLGERIDGRFEAAPEWAAWSDDDVGFLPVFTAGLRRGDYLIGVRNLTDQTDEITLRIVREREASPILREVQAFEDSPSLVQEALDSFTRTLEVAKEEGSVEVIAMVSADHEYNETMRFNEEWNWGRVRVNQRGRYEIAARADSFGDPLLAWVRERTTVGYGFADIEVVDDVEGLDPVIERSLEPGIYFLGLRMFDDVTLDVTVSIRQVAEDDIGFRTLEESPGLIEAD